MGEHISRAETRRRAVEISRQAEAQRARLVSEEAAREGYADPAPTTGAAEVREGLAKLAWMALAPAGEPGAYRFSREEIGTYATHLAQCPALASPPARGAAKCDCLSVGGFFIKCKAIGGEVANRCSPAVPPAEEPDARAAAFEEAATIAEEEAADADAHGLSVGSIYAHRIKNRIRSAAGPRDGEATP